MNLLDTINQTLNQSLFPGHRELRSNGWEEAKNHQMPRDCEASFWDFTSDPDPDVNYVYLKTIDINGSEKFMRYQLVEKPIPKFEPENYVTKNDFNEFKEDILDAINSLKQSGSGGNRPGNSSKQSGRTGNEFRGSETDIQTGGQ